MLEQIKAVIFDLDGTLVDSMWMWRTIDIEYLTNQGIEAVSYTHLNRDIQKFSKRERRGYLFFCQKDVRGKGSRSVNSSGTKRAKKAGKIDDDIGGNYQLLAV